MSRVLQLNQLTIKMYFTIAVTNFICQKEVVLILDIEIIDFLIGPMMVRNLVRIQTDQLTDKDLQEKLIL